MTGYLIGFKGSTISRLRQDSSCDVNVLRILEYEAALAYQYSNGIAKFSR